MMSIVAFALAQLVLLQATGQKLRGLRRLYTKDDHTRIICPFLGALVNEIREPMETETRVKVDAGLLLVL